MVRPEIPAVVECQTCGRMVKTMRSKYVLHSTFEMGPRCAASGQDVGEEALAATENVRAMEKVLLWATLLRDEDPRHVTTWITATPRDELEKLMTIALAGIPPNQSLGEVFGWLREMA